MSRHKNIQSILAETIESCLNIMRAGQTHRVNATHTIYKHQGEDRYQVIGDTHVQGASDAALATAIEVLAW